MILPLKELRKHEWSVSWSGGKDSTATVILMHRYEVPIKSIDYVRMMYDDGIPATLPIMTDFVDSTATVFRSWGYKVNIYPAIKTAVDVMNTVYQRSVVPGLNGNRYGCLAFCRGSCNLQKVKVRTLHKYVKHDFEMIGYAVDEVARLERLTSKKQSILATLGMTEGDAFRLCRSVGLLSPLYDLGISRDGCFFCPNASRAERNYIYENQPTLAQIIFNDISNTCARAYIKARSRNNWVHDYELTFAKPPSFLPKKFFEDEEGDQETFYY